MGLKDYEVILTNLFPLLSNATTVPKVMQKMVDDGARGIHNNKGLYAYHKEEGRQWGEAFSKFNLEIHRLAANYSEDEVKKQLNSQPVI